MKVLITSNYNSENTYSKVIIDGLRDKVFVVSEPQNFWSSNIDFDIIHIQWPEELFYWKNITLNDIERLSNKINYWKNKKARIVATLHNEIPHRKHDLDKEIYNIIYEQADVIVHLGDYSTNLYRNHYNVVIPHPNYNKSIKIKNVDDDDTVRFLSFGKIRNNEEEQFLIDAFKKACLPNASLIISNSLFAKKSYFSRSQYFKELIYKQKIKSLKKKGIILKRYKVQSDTLNNYFNQADVIIIPRLDTLNSGVLFMAYSFGKTVIGPSIGNIKEYLEISSNLIFDPNNINSLVSCFKQAINLNRNHIGRLNKNFSDENLAPEKIVSQHFNMYLNLCK
jgi:hypothetical protein